MPERISLSDIYAARSKITAIVARAPMIRSDSLSERIGGEVFLKLECLQDTGSFKVRGATNKILSLTDKERANGVITVSSGNHGRALAWVARKLGVTATICLYSNVPTGKIEAIRQLGGQVEICGSTYEEAEVAARQLMLDRGLVWSDPFDDPFVIAGQGTSGLEIMEDCPQVDSIIVPLSGGGLFSGIASAVKAIRPSVEMIGVANRFGNGMLASLEAVKPVPIEEHPSLADCMAGTISADNRHTFAITRDLIDRAILIEEEMLPQAMAFGFFEDRLVTEGGAALPIATLLDTNISAFHGKTVVLVISGRNVDPELFLKVVGEARKSGVEHN